MLKNNSAIAQYDLLFAVVLLLRSNNGMRFPNADFKLYWHSYTVKPVLNHYSKFPQEIWSQEASTASQLLIKSKLPTYKIYI